MNLQGVTKAGVLYRDISFQNMRINKKYVPIICNFDLAAVTHGETTGVRERTGTVVFMARGLLEGGLIQHQGFHDCESVYWLCAFALLLERAAKLKPYFVGITRSNKSLSDICALKNQIITSIRRCNKIEADRQFSVVNSPSASRQTSSPTPTVSPS